MQVAGDFSRLDAEIETELRLIDQERLAAEGANAAKKNFMRYLCVAVTWRGMLGYCFHADGSFIAIPFLTPRPLHPPHSFHELRVPLNAALLGLDELYETAAAGGGGLVDVSSASASASASSGSGSSASSPGTHLAAAPGSTLETVEIVLHSATLMSKLLDDFLRCEPQRWMRNAARSRVQQAPRLS